MNDSIVSSKLGLGGIDYLSEVSELAKILEIAKFVDNKILINNISSKETQKKKKKDGKIFAETTIHHLLLDDSYCDDFNTYSKIFPPLRGVDDRDALINGLKDGTIDIISSGHSFQKDISKDIAFELASFGISNDEIYLPLLYTKFVKSNIFSFSDITRFVSYNPAKIMNKNFGSIEEGKIANIVIFDETKESLVDTIAKKSPYYGLDLYGVIEKVFINGNLKYQY
jgi:dihydroorotase